MDLKLINKLDTYKKSYPYYPLPSNLSPYTEQELDKILMNNKIPQVLYDYLTKVSRVIYGSGHPSTFDCFIFDCIFSDKEKYKVIELNSGGCATSYVLVLEGPFEGEVYWTDEDTACCCLQSKSFTLYIK